MKLTLTLLLTGLFVLSLAGLWVEAQTLSTQSDVLACGHGEDDKADTDNQAVSCGGDDKADDDDKEVSCGGGEEKPHPTEKGEQA
jgi:hypothetical protein